MTVKNRIIAFVLGIVCTIGGGILTYFEFFGKGDQWYMDTSIFSYGTLMLGIVLVMVAFERKKKSTRDETGSSTKT